MGAAIDADFNKADRAIDIKLEIYFDVVPLVVTKSNYLVDAEWLEEGSADSTKIFGTVSSNEFSFRLFNESGIFSPTNNASPYFGKIKEGTKIKAFIRPDPTVDWSDIGTYFVTGWTTQVTGIYADVVANDIWHQIFYNPLPAYAITTNKAFNTFLQEVFSLLGHTVTVDTDLTDILSYAFVEGDTKSFLQNVVEASVAYLTSTRTGVPLIGALKNKAGEARAVITDSTQIKTAAVKQSITKAYNGVEVNYNVPQLSAITSLLSISSLVIPIGDTSLLNLEITNGPLNNVSMIHVASPSEAVKLKSFKATQWAIDVILTSSALSSCDINVYGKVLNFVGVRLEDKASKQLSVTSKYIQSELHALKYKTLLNKLISNDIPILTLETRGNPLLSIGDKVVVQSTKYNLNFTGIIQRMKYRYAGSLQCDVTLINAAIL